MKTKLAVGIVALACGAMTVACGSQNTIQQPPETLELRIYDAANNAKVGLTVADVVRSSPHAESGETAGSGLLYFRFTRDGVLKFRRLTREAASTAFNDSQSKSTTASMSGRRVDYRVYPDGLDVSSGLETDRLTLAVANRLADEIRNGP